MKLSEVNITYKSRTILDSRGNPTSELDLIYDGKVYRSSCPSGASTGKNECVVLVDNKSRYNGKNIDGVHKIIKNVIFPFLKKSDVDIKNSNSVDELMLTIDTSKNKENIGVNALLPFSLSFCKLAAKLNNLPLFKYISTIYNTSLQMPKPHFNVLNGGMHSGNDFKIQEIMICFDTDDINESIESASVFYHSLKSIISKKYGSLFTSVGDEGGFAPPINSISEGIELLIQAGNECNKKNFKIALDVAANSFFIDGKYYITDDSYSTEELCDYYLNMLKSYPQIYSIEDPFSEDDIQGWSMFSKKAPKSLQIVGDDLTVTNYNLIKIAGEKKLCNVLLVKPNQIGTVCETLKVVNMARSFGMKIMISHRSGETEDTFISDLSVGIGADYIKSGAPCRGERVAKYNQLLRIQECLHK